MLDYDLVVIGGGPAGSLAAFTAVQRGLNVLLLDKSQFPRVKPCGGGITIKALNLLPFSVAEVLETATGTVLIGHRFSKPDRVSTDGFICAFAQREKFDLLVHDATIDAGVEFAQISSLDGIAATPDRVDVIFDGGQNITAKYLIAADGANSQCRRMLQPKLAFTRGFALEGLVPYSAISVRPEMEFDFGCVDYGYGWIFPKATHANVGIYTCNSDVKISRTRLADYVQRKLCTDIIDNVVGFPLGFGGQSYVHTTERVLFAGDAAGLAEPLIGEGIHNALKSGIAAGECIADAVQSNRRIGTAYNARLSPIKRDIHRCHSLAHNFFYPNLDSIGRLAITSPMTKTVLMKGFAGGRTVVDIMDKSVTMPFQKPIFPPSLNGFQRQSGLVLA